MDTATGKLFLAPHSGFSLIENPYFVVFKRKFPSADSTTGNL
jgi:hypothetical protein